MDELKEKEVENENLSQEVDVNRSEERRVGKE